MQIENTTGHFRIIERLLNLRRGDLGRVAPLFFYHFLIISSLVVGQVVRDTLFLDRFQAVHLPYVDMTIAAFVLLVATGYLYSGQYTSLRTLQIGSLFAFAVIAGLFWWTTHIFKWTWLYPALYIWVGIFGVVAPAQMWILIIYLLSVRDKRLLGIVASGGIAGGIAGFLSRATVQRFDAEHLLFLMMILLAVSAALVIRIWRQWHPTLSEMDNSAKGRDTPVTWNLRQSIRHVRASNLLMIIAALVCLSSVVTNIAGWQFKAMAEQSILEKNDLAAFFGTFYGFVSIMGFLIAQVLAPRVLALSLRFALMILPIALVVGTFGVLVWGALWAATMLKGSDKILRYSIEKPAIESLYFPIPSHVMMHVKMFIDTVSWRLGDGLAGLIVLIFATALHITARQLSWVTLPLMGLWLLVVYVARRKYVETLSERLQQRRLSTEQTTIQTLDRATREMIADRLRAEDTDEILYALSLLDSEHHQMVHPAVRDLLVHPTAEIREKALSILNAGGDTTVVSQVEQLLDDEELGVRTEALLYLAHHTDVDPLGRIRELGDFPDFSIRSAIIAYLARSSDPNNIDTAREILNSMIQEQGPEGLRTRLEAARLMGTLPNLFEQYLEILVRDTNDEVAGQAIRVVGCEASPRVIRAVLERLRDSNLTTMATEALGRCGDGIVDQMQERLLDASSPIEMRREIPRILLLIDTPRAKQVLIDSMFADDTKLRSHIIASLTDLQNLHPDMDLDLQMVETLLVAEIIGHYRSYQIQDSLEQALDDDDTVLKALESSMTRDLERIFQLIKLMYPQRDLHSAYLGIRSENPKDRDNALEFLEQILKPELRNLLVPALDPDFSFAERVQLANRVVGTNIENPREALLTLIDHPEIWLKSCAVYTIGILGLTSLEAKLDECLEHPDPLLRETARQAKQRLAESKI